MFFFLLGSGSFKYVLFSPRSLGKIPILTNMFQGGWNQQLVQVFVTQLTEGDSIS